MGKSACQQLHAPLLSLLYVLCSLTSSSGCSKAGCHTNVLVPRGMCLICRGCLGGWIVSPGIHTNVRFQGFPAECCSAVRSMDSIWTLSGSNVVVEYVHVFSLICWLQRYWQIYFYLPCGQNFIYSELNYHQLLLIASYLPCRYESDDRTDPPLSTAPSILQQSSHMNIPWDHSVALNMY